MYILPSDFGISACHHRSHICPTTGWISIGTTGKYFDHGIQKSGLDKNVSSIVSQAELRAFSSIKTTINMAWDPKLLTGLGCVASMFLCAAGSAYASSHSGVYAMRSSGLKGFAPIVISGVLAIYGIIVSVLLALKFTGDENNSMTEEQGYRNLSAGLAVGFACLASGFGMATFIKELNLRQSCSPTGTVALAVQRSKAEPLLEGQQQCDFTSIDDGSADALTCPKPPVNFIYLCLCLCFLEAIGLYGLIVALFLLG